MDDEAFDTWPAKVSRLTAAQRSQGFRTLALAEACLNEAALLGIAAVPAALPCLMTAVAASGERDAPSPAVSTRVPASVSE
ncbi:MAG: hypothetical protein P4M00_23535, partial [Azospirillaceae bacterium]|nr:hypothetical protein [Azospirillaceae bacterium]